MDKISVIIPVYNVREYIGRCLESVLSQSFSNLEIICVDDGSTDESGDICEQYMRRDNRVRVFHLKNGGVSAARNFALTQMTGEWFAYVDADDWLESDFFEILYRNARQNTCDISACGFFRSSKFCIGEKNGNSRIYLFHSSEECIHNYICAGDSMQGMVWNKLYRSAIFRKIRFNTDVKVNEDCLYTYDVMRLCKKACLTNEKLYHWFYRKNSACHSKPISIDFSPANVFMELYEKTLVLKDENVSNSLKKNYVCAIIKLLMYAKYYNSDKTVKTAKKRCKNWKKDIWERLDIKTKIKYYVVIYVPWLARIIRKK